MLNRTVVVAGSVTLFCQLACAVYTQKPPPPSNEVPPIQQVNLQTFCVGCDKSFDMDTHNDVLKGLAANPYLAELRKALFTQDIVHQFESRAHYDNCDFDSAAKYITSLLDEADVHVDRALKAKEAGDQKVMMNSAGSAFFAIGQALHSVQDFYAHTNYVEMQAPKVKSVADIEVIAPWRPKGRDRIQELRSQGLYSGYVRWGFPQMCPAGTASHGDLAKDSATTKSGSAHLPHLPNLSQYKVAEILATEASLQLMADAFKRWPLLNELNGQRVAFEVLLDRRGIDGNK